MFLKAVTKLTAVFYVVLNLRRKKPVEDEEQLSAMTSESHRSVAAQSSVTRRFAEVKVQRKTWRSLEHPLPNRTLNLQQ